MPDRFETWASLVAWLNARLPLFMPALLAGGIGLLGAIYRRSRWRRMLAESGILAGTAGTLFPVLEHFGLAPSLANPIAAVIGLIGLEGLRSLAERYLGIKIGKREE